MSAPTPVDNIVEEYYEAINSVSDHDLWRYCRSFAIRELIHKAYRTGKEEGLLVAYLRHENTKNI